MPEGLPDKRAVRDALRDALAESLAAMTRAAEVTREGVVHEEARQEGSKDMRSTEQSYLARGQAMRAEELADELQRLDLLLLRDFGADDPVALGALVRVSLDDGSERVLFLVPQGGGTRLEVEGASITVITPKSPLGRALLGRRAGDGFEIRLRGEAREYIVEEIE